MRRDVFQAIADPTRRDIIGLLAKKSLTLNEVVEHFEISRPAISKHVRILKECGLVIVETSGRERLCHARPAPLKEVADWSARYSKFWNQKLDALGAFLEKDRRLKKRK